MSKVSPTFLYSQSISLLSFDPSKRSKLLNSPWSIEACLRQGIEISEIYTKSKKDISKQFGKQVDIDLRFTHYESKRKEKVRILLEERGQVIQDEEEEKIEYDPKSKKFMNLNLAQMTCQMSALNDTGSVEKERMLYSPTSEIDSAQEQQ